jgi:hypothetical protein
MSARWILVSLLLVGCVTVRQGSGVAATERMEIPASVDEVRVRLSMDVTVRAGDSPLVAVTCDDNLIEDVVVAWDEEGRLTLSHASPLWGRPLTDCSAEVVVGSLREVYAQGSGMVMVEGEHRLQAAHVNGSGDLEFFGALSEVERLESTGSGALVVPAAAGCELKVEHTGSGDMTIDALRACEVHVFQSGSGNLGVGEGRADVARVEVLGSGDVLAAGFQAERADLLLTGSGDLEIGVAARVKVRVLGSGDVIVHGQPQEREVETPGSGEVEFP